VFFIVSNHIRNVIIIISKYSIFGLFVFSYRSSPYNEFLSFFSYLRYDLSYQVL
jgi:hypothetical protein